MYCSHCGSKIPDNAKFCPSCGTPVRNRTQTGHYSEGSGSGRVAGYKPGSQSYNQKMRDTASARENAATVYYQTFSDPGKQAREENGIRQAGTSVQVGAIIGAIGGFMLLVASFMPVVNASLLGYEIQSLNYFEFSNYDSEDGVFMSIIGLIQIVLAILIAVLALSKKKIAGVVVSVVALFFTSYMLSILLEVASESYGIAKIVQGPYVALVGAIVSLIGCIMIKKR